MPLCTNFFFNIIGVLDELANINIDSKAHINLVFKTLSEIYLYSQKRSISGLDDVLKELEEKMGEKAIDSNSVLKLLTDIKNILIDWYDRTPKVLLIASDNLKEMICNKLSEFGINSFSANGDFLNSIEMYKPNVIIIEDLYDTDTAEKLELILSRKRIPVIIVSSSDKSLQFLKLGAIDCVDESHIDELILKVKNIIDIFYDEGANNQTKQSKKEYSILFVDDEKIILSILTTKYKNKGYKVYSASDGMEALEILNKNQIDVVVTDYYMKIMNGDELVKNIKKNHKNTKVILLTSQSSEDYIKKAFEIGVDDYVVKPFSPTELDSRIKRLLLE
jgi:DNA-binding response OmpR family regulator